MLVTTKRTKHLHNISTSITIGNAQIHFKQSVKNFSVKSDCYLTMHEHVSTIAWKSNLDLCLNTGYHLPRRHRSSRGVKRKKHNLHSFIVASFNAQSVKGNDMACKRCEISTFIKDNGVDLFFCDRNMA